MFFVGADGTFCFGLLSESFGFSFYIFSEIFGCQSIAHNVSSSPSRNCFGKQKHNENRELGSAALKITSPLFSQDRIGEIRRKPKGQRGKGKGEDRGVCERGCYFASCPFFFASSTTLAIAKRYPVGRLYTWFWRENCCGIVCWWTNELKKRKEERSK